jgi:hypothetical protein
LSPTVEGLGPINGLYAVTFGLSKSHIIRTFAFQGEGGMRTRLFSEPTDRLTGFADLVTFQKWMTGFQVIDD